MDYKNEIIQGDAIEVLRGMPANFIDCCVTSPPYFNLRDYGQDGQIGLEDTPEEYISNLVNVFREVNRVLKSTGTMWVNIGDSYAGSGKGGAKYPDSVAGSKQATNKGTIGCPAIVKKYSGYKNKDLIGIPWMLAFALRADGWYLRQDIIWEKPNAFPESVQDRCTKSHEYIFLLAKSSRYYFDGDAIKEPAGTWHGSRFDDGKNLINHPNVGTKERRMQSVTDGPLYRHKRDVWSVPTAALKDAHFATYPEKLIAPIIKAASCGGGIVLDPFMGAGTTAVVAKKLGRSYIGVELNPDYIKIAEKRIAELGCLF